MKDLRIRLSLRAVTGSTWKHPHASCAPAAVMLQSQQQQPESRNVMILEEKKLRERKQKPRRGGENLLTPAAESRLLSNATEHGCLCRRRTSAEVGSSIGTESDGREQRAGMSHRQAFHARHSVLILVRTCWLPLPLRPCTHIRTGAAAAAVAVQAGLCVFRCCECSEP